MPSPAVSQEEFRTSDLALAAVLHLCDFRHTRMELIDRRNAVWVFEATPAVMEVAEDYQDGVTQVEPRDFMKAVASARNDLYTFLDSNA